MAKFMLDGQVIEPDASLGIKDGYKNSLRLA